MSGEPSWITAALMLGGALFVVGLAAFGRAVKGFRRVSLSVACPATGHPARLVTLQSERTGEHTDVVRCSELSGDVTCDRACLAQANPSRLS